MKKMLILGMTVLILSMLLTACGDGGGGHEHTYSWSWSYDETQHWRECEVEGCDAKIEIENHTATHGSCGYCNYSYHTYSTTWSSDEYTHWKNCTFAGCDSYTESAYHDPNNAICLTCGNDGHTHYYHVSGWSSDETQHWKVCGFQDCEEKSEIADHAPADGVCTTCGYDNTPAHIHSYSSEWSSNATQHWKECTSTSCDAKTDTADHTLAHGLCTTCGYGEVSHTYGTEWSSDATQHWKECTFADCDAKTTANHQYVYTVTSTLYPAQSTPTCSVCNYVGTVRNTEIGDIGPAGGIISYVKSSGFTVQGYTGATGSFAEYTAYYMEAAPGDPVYGARSWGGYGTLVDDVTTFTSTTDNNAKLIGNGRRDTQIMVNHPVQIQMEVISAAQSCASKTVTVGGTVFNDWFLPSLGELFEMYHAIGQALTSDAFWSSSQYDSNKAWSYNFSSSLRSEYAKDIGIGVCAVRAF